MISVKEELKQFKKKTVNESNLPLNDLYEPLHEVENKISNLDKVNKKAVISMGLIASELEEKQNQINEIKRELRNRETQEIRFVKKIANVLDQIDYIYQYAVSTKDEKLIENLEQSLKVIRKELREVNFEEIPTVGEIFDSESHDCIKAVENNQYDRYEITEVINKGYKYNGKVIRPASVVAVK